LAFRQSLFQARGILIARRRVFLKATLDDRAQVRRDRRAQKVRRRHRVATMGRDHQILRGAFKRRFAEKKVSGPFSRVELKRPWLR